MRECEITPYGFSEPRIKQEKNEEKQYLSEAIKNLGSATNLKRLFEK